MIINDHQWWLMKIYALVICNSLLLKIATEIVVLPIKLGDVPWFCMFTRVYIMSYPPCFPYLMVGYCKPYYHVISCYIHPPMCIRRFAARTLRERCGKHWVPCTIWGQNRLGPFLRLPWDGGKSVFLGRPAGPPKQVGATEGEIWCREYLNILEDYGIFNGIYSGYEWDIEWEYRMGYIYNGINILIYTSTLHCRGKNGRSKKIGQTNQKMIHFVPNMYVSGKISALRPGTQTVMIFGTTKKAENYLKQRDFRDLRVFACFCGFLRAFCGFFCGFYPQSFDALQTFFGLCLTKPKNMQSKS